MTIQLNDTDRTLLALYPRWRDVMTEWDGISDQIERANCNAYILRRGFASVGREREALEGQIIA